MLKTDSAASIRSQGKYMKYASLDLWWWQRDCKRLAWTLYNIRSYWLFKQHPYTQVQLCPSDPNILFKLCRRHFLIKSRFLRQWHWRADA